ncbi:MAG TPA: DUF5667 domain-containing protein [Candidatus Methylomirabilis sp.]|nr:DUF5667 domain-containing protein [Candidatus Methylomirabilis sp.]
MLWNLKWKLHRLSRRADPDPAFQAALKKALLARIAPRPWYAIIMKPIAATVSVATMLGAGTAAYAYTSDDVLPDHLLYPVREQVERMEQAVASSPEKRAAVQLKQLKKRTREMEMMAAKKRMISQPHVERFTNGFDQAVRAGDELSNGERARFDEALSAVEQTQVRVLERMKESIPEEADRERLEVVIEEETRNVTERIEKLEEKRKRQFELQFKRREAILQRLPWKLEENDVRVLPAEEADDALEQPMDVQAPPEATTTTRMPPKVRIEPPPVRKPIPLAPDRLDAIRMRLRGIIERGRLRILHRKDGGVELASTSSTPPGIRLILSDINARLSREPWLIAPDQTKPSIPKPPLDRPPIEEVPMMEKPALEPQIVR